MMEQNGIGGWRTVIKGIFQFLSALVWTASAQQQPSVGAPAAGQARQGAAQQGPREYPPNDRIGIDINRYIGNCAPVHGELFNRLRISELEMFETKIVT